MFRSAALAARSVQTAVATARSARHLAASVTCRTPEACAHAPSRSTDAPCRAVAAAAVPSGARTFCADAAKPAAPTGPVPSEADVVVIGGGSIGASVLYHLAKLGVTNTVLLEKDSLTAGTTWHSAGLLWRLRPSDVDIELLTHSRDMAKQLEGETGLSTGWIENGGMFIANNMERLDEYRRLQTIGKFYGIDSQVLSPAEAKDIYPLMNVDDVYGVLYSPTDGTIDPNGIVHAYARGATRLGAKVIERCSVTDIEKENGEVSLVKTAHGNIKTKVVINACGVWAPKIGNMVGVPTPLCAMHHAYVVTEKIPGIQGMPNIRDHDASVYLKLQGDALSIGGYEQNPIYWEKVQDDFAFSLFDLDWDVFGAHIEGQVNRVPAIEEAGIKSTVCGPESFTPDHKPLVGPTEVRGFWQACGFNSAGIMMGGGCGRELAHWVVKGHPTVDMFSMEPSRFSREVNSDKRWIDERSHEAYAKNYAVVWPHDAPLAARDMRTDPLHKALQGRGCVYSEVFGWERPAWFSDAPAELRPYDFYGYYGHDKNEDYTYADHLEADYTFRDFPASHGAVGREVNACRSTAVIFNQSTFGKLIVSGPDAAAAMEWICTNEVDKEEGATTYTTLCHAGGGIVADLTVSCIEPAANGDKQFYVATTGATAEHDELHFRTAIQDAGFNATVTNQTTDAGVLSVMGRNSRAILQAVADDPEAFDAANFAFSTHKMVKVAGHWVRALRLTYVGELGFELHTPAAALEEVYAAIIAAGEGDLGLVDAGYHALDELSLEKGYKHWHGDIRVDDTPLEAGMAFLCKLKTDTDFLGRAAIEAQRAAGLKKRMICLTLDEQVPVHGLELILRNGKPAGYVRRAGYSHTLGAPIAYGYIYAEPDQEKVTLKYVRDPEAVYEVETLGRVVSATMHAKVPVDPENHRIHDRYDMLADGL